MNDDYLKHYGVLGMRWGVRHDPRYKVGLKNIKKSDLSRDEKKKRKLDLKVDVASKRYASGYKKIPMSKEAHRRIQGDSVGKTVVKSLLMGSYGSMSYDQARGNGNGRGVSFAKGFGNNVLNKYTLGIRGFSEGHNARKETGRSLRRLGN